MAESVSIDETDRDGNTMLTSPESRRSTTLAQPAPRFDARGFDRETFRPVTLIDRRDTQWQDVRLAFDAWDDLHARCGSDTIARYALNGHGVQGLLKAARLRAGLDPEGEGIHFNSEGDACFVHFTSLAEAVESAVLLAAVLQSAQSIAEMAGIALEHGFED
jgi:hypothetical protein